MSEPIKLPPIHENVRSYTRIMLQEYATQAVEQATADLRAECDALRAQLPEGMKDCTITFSQCERGHGHLSATNWVQHPCMVCERDALRYLLDRAADMLHECGLRDEIYAALKEAK